MSPVRPRSATRNRGRGVALVALVWASVRCRVFAGFVAGGGRLAWAGLLRRGGRAVAGSPARGLGAAAGVTVGWTVAIGGRRGGRLRRRCRLGLEGRFLRVEHVLDRVVDVGVRGLAARADQGHGVRGLVRALQVEVALLAAVGRVARGA